MGEPLVVVPAIRPRRQGEFWLIVIAIALWSFQGLVDLATAFSYAVPRGIGFAGAAAGLLFAGLSMLLRLAAPNTLSGIWDLDRSTRDATIRRDPCPRT